MTQYAVHDAGGYVLGLVEEDEQPASANGRFYTAVASPVSGWPTPPCKAARLTINTNTGALAWEDPRTAEQAWADVRARRDAILLESDWRATKATDRGGAEATAWTLSPWRTYRQALRDITAQADPFNITWPTPPSE